MIVAETDLTRVHFVDRGGDTIVITFAHMDYDCDAGGFWGDAALQTLNCSAIGIVCKGNNWFPEADMANHYDLIRNTIFPYINTIGYGFSMGGYAAVKFSSKLEISKTIALSPQFSIDPDDVYNYDRRLVHHFRSELNADMSIKGPDIGGKIYMVFDPYLSLDMWNAQQIVKSCSSVRQLYAPWLGHETIDLFVGSIVFRELIRLVISDDESGLKRLIGARRRQSQRRAVQVANCALVRHPCWGHDIFSRYCSDVPDEVLEVWGSQLRRGRPNGIGGVVR